MLFNLTPHALLFTIAAIGISETAYLIRKRIAAEQPVCPIGQGCEIVLNSKYNRLILGIHNEYLGLVFYTVFSAVAALLVIGVNYGSALVLLARAMLIGATLMSLMFLYIQGRVLKAWCFWCVMSAITVGLMDIIVLTAKLI